MRSKGTGSSRSRVAPAAAAKEPLRVAVQSFYCSSMAQYIQDSGLLDDLDYDIEWIVFNGGAPINEAMGEWDVAITGGAAVYALANYECKLILHQVNGTDGNYVVARKNDPILEAKTAEEQAELVKGKNILTTFGQTGHYTANLWIQSLGIDPSECNLINLEVANIYNSWVAGEGDYAVLTEPYCYYDMDEIDSTVFATLDSVGGSLFESTVCTKEAYENRYDDIVAFGRILYKATDALSKDEEMAAKSVSAWYEACGKTLTFEDAKTSLEGKPMIGIEEAKTITLGEFMNSYAAWFESRELIDATGLENVKNNIATDVFADIIAGLEHCTEGSIVVDGEEVNGPSTNRGMVYQTTNLFMWNTVMQNVEFGPSVRHVPRKIRRATAQKYIDLVGLTGFEKHYPVKLSGGMQQRVVIARAFAVEPELLLMDELYGQLDLQLKYHLEDELINLCKKTGTTVIFITHNIEEAVYLSDRILVLTNKPTKIKENIINELPRPRKVSDPEFVALRN